MPSDAEQRFLSLLSAHDHTAQVLNLLESAVPPEEFKRLVLIAEAKYASPFQRIAPGGDLRSLVLSDTEIVLDTVDTTDPAIQRVLTWKMAEGLKVVSLGTYVAGGKSMISTSATAYKL